MKPEIIYWASCYDNVGVGVEVIGNLYIYHKYRSEFYRKSIPLLKIDLYESPIIKNWIQSLDNNGNAGIKFKDAHELYEDAYHIWKTTPLFAAKIKKDFLPFLREEQIDKILEKNK